jgi:hypothetical protein
MILTEEEKIKLREKYEFTIQKIRDIERREIDTEYIRYNALLDYERSCLIATNYWIVMAGKNFIDVPTKDIRFWKYFDEKCFDIAQLKFKINLKPNFNPVNIVIQDQVEEMCKEYLSKNNMANRGVYDGDAEKQLTGLIGEVIVYKFLKGNYPDLKNKKNCFDGGIDINYKTHTIDVKTMGRKTWVKPDFVNNFIALQKNYKCDIIIFCSLNKKEKVLEICGWIYKNELDTKGKFYKEGEIRKRDDGTTIITSTDNYEIQNKDLYDIIDLTK